MRIVKKQLMSLSFDKCLNKKSVFVIWIYLSTNNYYGHRYSRIYVTAKTKLYKRQQSLAPPKKVKKCQNNQIVFGL